MNDLRQDPLLANTTEVKGYKVLPPCVVYARIGQGGMGAVYRGHHLNLDIDVAVKCLKPSLVADDPTFVDRFRREGRSAARINHQNVIRVFDVAESGGLHYLIMEHVQGETARQRVERKGPLAVPEALQIVYEAALGLGEAHRLGIVHRDIKPDNLLISTRGQVKVADLGLAKPTLGGETSALSMAGQVMGTPPYMPPEQWNGGTITGAADVWALGATLYYLLTGHEAIRGETVANVMSKIVLQPFPDVREHRSEVSQEVFAVLAKATGKAPGDRFLDGAEFADAIAALNEHRITLRDTDAGTTELRTMLSPPPIRQIEEIKELLREGSRPPGVGTPPPKPSVSEEGAATTVSGSRRRRSRTPVLLAAALLLGGGAAGVFWWQAGKDVGDDPGPAGEAPPPSTATAPARDGDRPDAEDVAALPDPLAEVDELARQGRWVEALVAARDVFAARPGLEGREARVAALLASAGEALAGRLVRAAPTGPVVRGEPATFAGALDDPFVRELRLAGDAVERAGDGSFSAARTPDADGRVAVQVVLTSDDVVDLEPWQVELREPPPAPPAPLPTAVFVDVPRPEPAPADGVVTTDRVTVVGRANRPRVALRMNGTALAGVVWQEDGGFRVEVPLASEGRNRLAFEIGAPDSDAADATAAVEVVRLTAAPVLTLVEPANGAFATDAAALTVVVEASVGTDAVTAKSAGNGDVAFDMVAGGPRWRSRAPLRLRPGANYVELTAKNRVDSTTTTLIITCRATPAGIARVRLKGRSGDLAAGAEPVYVQRAPTLQVELTGDAARLLVDGEPAESTFSLKDLREGEATEVVLRAQNDLGASSPWVGRFVLDSTQPTVTSEPPPASAPDAAVTLRGSWTDAGGLRSIVIVRADSTQVPAEHSADAGRDGRAGTWAASLRAGPVREQLTVVATDLAGNERRLTVDLDVTAPAPTPRPDPKPAPELAAAIDAARFEAVDELDADGFPRTLRHKASGIELLAVRGAGGGRPRFYVARDMVTAQQWDGRGDDEPKVDVSGQDVLRQLATPRLRGLALPTPAEWDEVVAARDPDVRRVEAGLREWLAPASMTDSNWPIRKDPSVTSARSTTSSRYRGFRVVLRLR